MKELMTCNVPGETITQCVLLISSSGRLFSTACRRAWMILLNTSILPFVWGVLRIGALCLDFKLLHQIPAWLIQSFYSGASVLTRICLQSIWTWNTHHVYLLRLGYKAALTFSERLTVYFGYIAKTLVLGCQWPVYYQNSEGFDQWCKENAESPRVGRLAVK